MGIHERGRRSSAASGGSHVTWVGGELLVSMMCLVSALIHVLPGSSPRLGLRLGLCMLVCLGLRLRLRLSLRLCVRLGLSLGLDMSLRLEFMHLYWMDWGWLEREKACDVAVLLTKRAVV